MRSFIRLLWTACLLLPTLAAGAQDTTLAPLQTIPSVDVTRYTGRWYEIAKFPNRFQTQCVSDTVAEYRPLGNGRVEVRNRCGLQDGTVEDAVGVARQIGAAESPKFQVRFAPAWLSFLTVVWGDYWIIDLDANYTLAAVSEPKREYLWILSRSPVVDAETYRALLTRLQAIGLDINKLVTTKQTGA